MSEIDRPRLSDIFYTATEYKRFHGNILLGNHVPLDQLLEAIDDNFCEPDEEFIPVRVTTGLELSTLAGVSGSMTEMAFTDGLLEESVYAPKDRDREYVGLKLTGLPSYAAHIDKEERQGRYVSSRIHIQTPLKAPEFRQMVGELQVELKNIKFFCEFWGDRGKSLAISNQ